MLKQAAGCGLQKIEKRNILRKKTRLWKLARPVFLK
jgi:hypothetical protein